MLLQSGPFMISSDIQPLISWCSWLSFISNVSRSGRSPGEVLRVEAEQKSDGSLWRGDFTSGYIEDITRKTGNCKKFSVFVKMLRSAIVQDSDAVFVSLLTYYELEVLKARKTNASHIPRDSSNNKRYLILTYVGEFDRVHYPLPLLFEDASEPESLKRTIHRLKAEMAELRSKLLSQSKKQRLPDAQLELSEEGHFCEDYSERYGAEKARERETRFVKEILAWRNKHKTLLAKYEAKKDCYKDLQAWRRKAELLQEDLKRERDKHKRSVANLMLEKVALMEEVKKYRDGETRTRVRLRESESELDHLRRRMKAFSSREVSARLHNRSSATNSRRPSPQSEGQRSSSCPDFRPRTTTCRDHQRGRHMTTDQLRPRTYSRSPQPYVNSSITSHRYGSGHSSFSDRSGTPPLQRGRASPRSACCGTSPGKSWRRVPVQDARSGMSCLPNTAELKKIREDRPRDESPGKLLKEVKDKLAKYAVMEREDRSDRSSILSGCISNEQDISHGQTVASTDYDIDARIAALQNFLHAR